MNNKPLKLTLVVAMLAIVNSPNSLAEGFRNPTSGAINLGRSGGRIAHVDNASAITQNPANLMDLKRPEVTVSFNPVYISVEHQNASGATAETENAWKFLPAAYASMPILDDKYVIGLGITSPYGLSNEWKNAGGFADTANQGSLRYTTPHFSELQTILVNPTVAFDVSEKVSMGLGLDIQWSQLTFKQHVFPNGRFVAESDGIGAGANLGMTWKITDRHRLAFTARSPITVNYDGDFNMNVPAAGLNVNTSFSSEIEFPTQLHLGYGIELTDTIRLEADVEFLEFSNFDTLPTQTGVPLPGLPTSLNQDWHNTYTIGMGGDWKFAENWIMRASYQFFESPVPNATLSPTIPDSNQNVLTAGIGYGSDNYSIDLGYGLVIYDERKINQGGIYDGNFDFAVHLFSLTYTKKF
ncbi:MAG: outer membrane protein transport protein [Verrucomicrobiota bacterium]|nr:outer membrane protein transport protein [Verrucomicrobiota bacterium]